MTATCKHKRAAPCPYCAAGIRADDYWQMLKWRAELKRKGKRAVRRDA